MLKSSTNPTSNGRKSAKAPVLALAIPTLLLLLAGESNSVLASQGQSLRTRVHNEVVWTDRGDIEAEIHFGTEVAARIIGRYGLYENKNLTLYVNLIARSLAENSNRPELYYTVGVLDTDIVNAFATPGGFIFITRGAIDLMKNEAELAGAIAHEMIHINQKHIVKELNIKGKSGGAMAGMGKLVGGAGETFQIAFSQAIDGAMNVLFKNGYKQTDELEADTMAAMLSAATGYDPNALVDLLKRLMTSEKEVSPSDRGVIASIELAKGSGKKPGDEKKKEKRGLIGGTTNLIKKGVGTIKKGVGKVVDVVEDTAIIGDATKLVRKGVGKVVGTVESTVKTVTDTDSKTTTPTKVTNVSYLKQLHPPFEKRIKWVENTIESQGLAGGKYRTKKGRFLEYTKK